MQGWRCRGGKAGAIVLPNAIGYSAGAVHWQEVKEQGGPGRLEEGRQAGTLCKNLQEKICAEARG